MLARDAYTYLHVLLVAGIALDLMRFEERRTTLQNTVDRAVLAAADLNQTLEPKAVVKDYFLKAGLTPPKDSDITVDQGAFNEWRTVQASVTEQMPTWFMNMVGVKELTTPADSTAEERIGQRLEPRLARDLRLGAALGPVGRVEVFQLDLGFCAVDGMR